MKVYFAGPDVFYDNAIEFGNFCKDSATSLGMIGLFPMDNEVAATHPNPGYEIYKKNREMLDSADVVVVNLNDFRGYDPDAGTVWEMAYAIAKEKKVVGYMSTDDTLVQRHKNEGGATEKDGHVYDSRGRKIENFGNRVNVMLQHSAEAIVVGDVVDALKYVRNNLMPKYLNDIGM